MATETEIITALRAALVPRLPGLAIVQGYQPSAQGAPNGPHLTLWNVGDTDYGWTARREVWNLEELRFDHVEEQVRETVFQVNATVPNLRPGDRTPAEWLALTRAHLRSDPVLAELRAAGLSILRVRDVRSVPLQRDNDQYEVSQSFDVTVRHSDILTLTTPVAAGVDLIIERV